jgi:hypothetical protein
MRVLPNVSMFSSVSGTSSTNPSIAISRRDRSHAPFVPCPARGTATRSNNSRSGSGPSRCLAWVIAEVDGTCQEPDHEFMLCSEPTSFRITSS